MIEVLRPRKFFAPSYGVKTRLRRRLKVKTSINELQWEGAKNLREMNKEKWNGIRLNMSESGSSEVRKERSEGTRSLKWSEAARLIRRGAPGRFWWISSKLAPAIPSACDTVVVVSLSKALWRESCRSFFQCLPIWLEIFVSIPKIPIRFLLIQLPYFHLLLRQLSFPFDLAPTSIGPAVTLFFPASAFGSLDTEKDFHLISGIPSYPSICPLSSYKSGCPVLIWMRNSKALSSLPHTRKKRRTLSHLLIEEPYLSPWTIFVNGER